MAPMAIAETRLGKKWAGLNREKLGQMFNREKLGSVNVGQTERWASVLGGAALALRGGRRSKGIAGLAGLAAVAGLPLILRGATGHCPVYQKMGIDRAEGSTSGKGTALASERVLVDEVDEEPSTRLNATPTF